MGANWTVRRKLSVAPHPRRGYQPHGAHWNVQVVRAKVTKRCLWNACKALTLGVVLLLAGCTMATVGKYRILYTRILPGLPNQRQVERERWRAAFTALPIFLNFFTRPVSLYCEEYVCV